MIPSIKLLTSWLLLCAIAQAQTVMVTVTEVATASPTSPHPASYTSLEKFEDTVMSWSNDYRGKYNASHLVWNETLTEYAKNWADKCLWQHSHGPYGENLAFGYPNASAAVVAWGDEGLLYNFDKPTGFTEETGHFTQLVWKGTAEVGCAAVDCGYDDTAKTDNGEYTRAQGWYVVCEYTPAGNVVGDQDHYFKMNVQPSIVVEEGPSTTTTRTQAASTASTTSTTSASTATSTADSGAMGIRGMLEGAHIWKVLPGLMVVAHVL
ncbi:hypothetical protein MW887_010024 [Aspergillus wentii]|nr:hypothetical protein MW887_010024 [Aspergillus wentii]